MPAQGGNFAAKARLKGIWELDMPRKTRISYRLDETNDEKLAGRKAGNSEGVI